MRGILQQASVILLLGVALGLAGNQASPRGLPLIAPPRKAIKADEFIALEKAKELWYGGATLFLDAREPADFEAGHIGNALNLPAQSFEQHFSEIAPILSPESKMVLYCDGMDCELSQRLQESLRQLGYTNTHLLLGGWTTWREAGLPTVQKGQQ